MGESLSGEGKRLKTGKELWCDDGKVYFRRDGLEMDKEGKASGKGN